jgi:hypothetical protein
MTTTTTSSKTKQTTEDTNPVAAVLNKIEDTIFGKVDEKSRANVEAASEKGALSWQEVSANKEVNSLVLASGRKTSIDSIKTLLDQGFVLNLMLENHDSVAGQIVPNVVSDGSPATFATGNILGFIFLLEVDDRTGAPGTLGISDAGGSRSYSIKSANGVIAGIVWCTVQEPVTNYNPTDGITTSLSSETSLMNFNSGDFVFTATGCQGEIYPIIPHRGFVDLITKAIGDSTYTFDKLSADLVKQMRAL